MKPKKVLKKMALNKETIANFNGVDMSQIKGKGICPPLCMCKVFTCRTCLQGTCTCSDFVTLGLDCKIETLTDCEQIP